MRTLVFAVVFPAFGWAAQQQCVVPDPDKLDCGHVGTKQPDCEAKGCCWQPVSGSTLANVPWCFYPVGTTCEGNWSATDAGFTQSFVDTMTRRFERNLNINGSGMVVAAPDYNTPGGSYYFHWMRDAGLSMWTYMKLNNYSYDQVQGAVGAYERWVARAQKASDPHGIDVRVEPKFTIPAGNVYTGGWCRPQTDGPALRANALVTWARILLSEGYTDRAKNVWALIQTDLAWVVKNWQAEQQEQGCDLWEEVRSGDFFWNRMAYAYSLGEAADLAGQLGQSGDEYRRTATAVRQAIAEHFNGQYIYESQNRLMDTSVIHAVTSFGKDVFPPLSSEVAKTVDRFNEVFCREYPLNTKDTKAGVPGLLYGRYPGDSYAGGNPWQLLSAVYAECFYRVSQSLAELEKTRGRGFPLGDAHAEWAKVLKLPPGATSAALRAAAKKAGDSIMTRIWTHVRGDGGMITEQIDKESGEQKSAKDLTWSYANILHALEVRRGL